MSVKGTLITLVLFVVLVGIYKWDKGKRESTEKAKEQAAKIMQFEAKDVDSLVLSNKGESIELKKSGGDEENPNWEILKPIQTKADASQVKSIVESLAGAKKQEIFELAKDQKLADYGLETPEVKAEVKSEDKGQFVNILFGDRKTGMGDYFATIESEKNKVFLVPPHVQSLLVKPLFDLRDKTVISAPADDVTSVTLSMDLAGEMVAEKVDGKWRLKSPLEDAGDEVAIGDLLRKIDGARAADFVDTTGTLQLASYGLDNPAYRLTVWGPKLKEERAFLLGEKVPEEDQYYAKAENADQVVMVPGDVQVQLAKSFDEYRSKDLFPAVGVEAGEIDVTLDGKSYGLKKDDEGQWSFAEAAEGKIDQAGVEDMLAALVELRVKEFKVDDSATTDTAVYGLDSPTLTVELRAKDGKRVDRATIGRVDNGEQVIYAKREGSPSILALEWKDPGQFMKSAEDLIERKVAAFKTEDAARIEVQTADGAKKEYMFEKKEDAWSGGPVGQDGTTIPEMEAQSFLNALTDLRYQKLHAAGSKDIEMTTAPKDIETTLTLKSATGETLLDVGVSGVQVDERFLSQSDGSAYAVKDMDYQRVDGALKALLGTVAATEE